MTRRRTILLLLWVLLLAAGHEACGETITDITDRFTGHWGQDEQVTHNSDGSITFVGQTWGGLSYYVNGDWSAYARLVFEFKQAPTVDVQPIVLYQNGGNEQNYTRAGCTEAYIDLNPNKASGVRQVALQTAQNSTLYISRIFLVSNDEAAGHSHEDDNEEQDARLLLNELMQSNIDCLTDDLNEFPDSWVELYNAGTTAVRLSRYSLGISPDPDAAWPLPDRQVKAGGHIIIYCDKVGDGLHTDFRLESGKGCQVFLFRDGQVIDQLTDLRKQPAPNIAYGRSSDGSNEWGYELSFSPTGPNGGGVCDHDHLLGTPVFSLAGQVFTANSTQSLVLSVPEGSPAGTEIRYTLNGTEPTRQSMRYAEPITFSTTTVVKAKLFCQGWLSPRAVTHSYIFFPRQLTLPVVSIVTNNSYLNDSRIGIFANNGDGKRNDWRRPINIEFFMDGENTPATLNQLCETRVCGAASRGAKMKSMAIYAHKRFGTKRFEHEFFPDQCPGLTDYKSLVLRNAGNDFDYLYMRDAIVQRSMATWQDLDWQAWRPAIVYINGRYNGMLNIRERGNENNVYTHYDGLEDIDLIENWGDLKEGTWDAYYAFKAFYNEHGHTMAEFEQWMDCEEFINLMAMNLFFCNFDFPGNNIIMWRPRTADGRWRWIAKDCDYTMGIYGDPVNYKILDWLYTPGYDGNKNWGGNSSNATRLFRRLMEDADFHRTFIDRTAVYMGDILSEPKVRRLWDAMYEQIRYEYPFHRDLVNHWWPNYDEELTKARTWLAQRPAVFYQQLADYYNLGKPVPMTVSWEPAEAPDVDIVFNDVRLSDGQFDGMFFTGRDLVLQGSAGADKEVKGWQVAQTAANGSVTRYEVAGPMLTMAMPQCARLDVTPLVGTSSAIATVAARPWSWQWDGTQLHVSGVEAGTRIALYDLRGILIGSVQSADGDVLLTTGNRRTLVLKVGEVSRIVHRQ